MHTEPINPGVVTTMSLLARTGAPGDVLRQRVAVPAKTSQVVASRRVVALEILNLLRIRRTMGRVRMQLARGAPGAEMLPVGGGKQMTRRMLFAYAQVAFACSLRNVCIARRALAKLTEGSAT